MRSLSLLTAVVGLAAVLLAPVPVVAQGCGLNDDGFGAAGCCVPTTPALPPFPGFQIGGSYACFKDCFTEATFPIRVSTSHIGVLCDLALVPITIAPGVPGSPGYTGILAAKYSRTWTEALVPGVVPRQVWRFLINGDLNVNAGAAPCPIPPHPGSPVRVHFHGHLDYACDTNAAGITTFSMALSLHHLPGCIEHNMFSCVPLYGVPAHNDRSYHLVAPAGFAWGGAPIAAGPVLGEAVRSLNFLPFYTCLGEGRIIQGAVNPMSQNCVCANPLPPYNAWSHDAHTGTVACGSIVTPYSSVPMAAPLPPLLTGAMQLGVGVWTLPPGTFPDGRSLNTHWGCFNYFDQCNPNDPPYHFVQGVSTSGVPVTPFGAPGAPVNTVLDLQDMINTNALTGGPIQPAWGCLYVSKLVWNINI